MTDTKAANNKPAVEEPKKAKDKKVKFVHNALALGLIIGTFAICAAVALIVILPIV